MVLERIRSFKRRVGPLWWYSLCMFCVSRAGDLISLFVGVFLVPDVMSRTSLGAILPLTKLAVLIGAPLNVALAVALKYVGVFSVAGQKGKIKALLRDLCILSAVLSAAMVLLMWWRRDFIQARLKFEEGHVVWLVAGMGILSFWVPLANTAARGLKKFYSLIAVRILQPACRLVVMLLLLRHLQVTGYLMAAIIAGLVVVLFLFRGIASYMARDIRSRSYSDDLPEMRHYMVRVGAWILFAALQGAVGPWIIRQHLPAADSAGYYLVALLGSIPLWVAPAMVPFLFPIVSERSERGQDTSRMHYQALAIAFSLGLGITVVLFLGGEWLLRLRESWRVYTGYAPLIWQVSLTTTLTVVMSCHATHENACKRFRYLRYFVPLVIVEVVVLYGGINGWGIVRPWVPADVWKAVDCVARNNIGFIVSFVLSIRFTIAVCILAELYRNRSQSADEKSRNPGAKTE